MSDVDANATAESNVADDVPWRPRFGLVLTLITATFFFALAAPTARWSILLGVGLLTLTAVVAANAARVSHRTRVLVGATAILLCIGAIIVLLVPASTGAESEARGTAFVLVAVLVALVAPIIVGGVLRDLKARGVTVQSVFGAISLFIMLGILFSGAYGAVANIDSEPLFTDGTDGDTQIRLYFSFVTLTTLGYGDFSPASDIGRTLAVAEALGGQLYLVTIIAVLVGSLGRAAIRPKS